MRVYTWTAAGLVQCYEPGCGIKLRIEVGPSEWLGAVFAGLLRELDSKWKDFLKRVDSLEIFPSENKGGVMDYKSIYLLLGYPYRFRSGLRVCFRGGILRFDQNLILDFMCRHDGIYNLVEVSK